MAVAMGDSVLQRYPLLRPLFFYLCGINLVDMLYAYVGLSEWLALCVALPLLLLLLFAWKLRWQIVYGMVFWALFLLLGICCYSHARSNTLYEWDSEELLYEARVVTEPSTRQRSLLCEVEVLGVCDSSAWHRVGYKVMVYMEPCDEVEALLPGDMVCFKGRVQPPRNFNDSLSFDYARYLTMQGISGTVYLPHRKWCKVGEGHLTLRDRMLRLRHDLSERYMINSFEGDALGVLLALTLGDRRELSDDVRDLYSDVGAAHVLALSGLHVGILYGVLSFALCGLLRRRSLRWVRELLVIAVLWTFVLLVGMSASVVRAVTMCTLYVFARWLSNDDSSSLHVLSLTALGMLLVRPLYLFDVSFQLSFMSMFSILWFEPYLEGIFRKHSLHPILAYPVGIVCMSLAAQLGTFPLVLHQFGTFPTYFLITNLLVVPVLFVVLLFILLWWVLTLVGFLELSQKLSFLLQSIVEVFNDCLYRIGQWPGAVQHVEEFNAFSVVFTYLLILFVGLFLIKKWPRGAVFATASLLGLLLSLL